MGLDLEETKCEDNPGKTSANGYDSISDARYCEVSQ